jgi:O-antigen/teichoic acid export membrane protein
MLKKNLFFTLILSVSQFIFPLITFPYSSRILGPKGIGTVNFIDSFTQYFILIAALGIPTYGIREIAKYRKDPIALNKLFSEIFIIHLASTTVFAILYLIMAIVLPTVYVHLNLVFAGIALMYFMVFAVEWFYGGIEKFSYITIRSLAIRILSIVALFVILKPGSRPVVYYLIIVFSAALTGLINIVNLRKHISLSIKHLQFKGHLKPLFILLSSALAVSVYVLMDNIILGFIKGDEAVGIYSTATKIVKIPFALLMAINAVIIPKVSMAYNEGKIDEIKELINKSFAFLCVVGLPVTVGINVSATFLVRSFAGVKFMNAVPVLQILSPVTMIVGCTFIFAAQLLTPMGKERVLVRISVAGMFFSLITNIILIPWLSYVGAAITNILTETLIAVLCYFLTKKYIDIRFDSGIFISCLIGSLFFIPIAFLIRSLKYNILYTDIAIIITCAVGYIIYVWFFVKNLYLDDLKRDILLRTGITKQPVL